MARRYFPGFALLFTLFFSYACMKHDPYTKTCRISTGSSTTLAAGKVTYRLHSKGSVIIDTLSYYGPDGLVHVIKPTMPFLINADLAAGASLGLMAAGTAINGQFHIDHQFITATDTIRAQDICAN